MNICIGDASLAPDTPLLDTTYPFVHTNKLHLGQLCSLLYVHFCRDSQILCSVEASSQSKNLKDGSRVRSNASIDGGGLIRPSLPVEEVRHRRRRRTPSRSGLGRNSSCAQTPRHCRVDNVIVVASPTGKAPPPAIGETS